MTQKEMAKAKSLIAQFNVLPMIGAEETVASVKSTLRKEGKPIDDSDIMIAATAIANDLILVTHNVKHFSRVSTLKIEDWQ